MSDVAKRATHLGQVGQHDNDVAKRATHLGQVGQHDSDVAKGATHLGQVGQHDELGAVRLDGERRRVCAHDVREVHAHLRRQYSGSVVSAQQYR